MSDADVLRVLVVEHDDADAELNVAALEQGGFAVEHDVAPTEIAMRALLATHNYDIVLADYRLPSWTGMRALAVLKELGRKIPLILVTGTLGEERAVDCLRNGVTDYILKTNLARLPTAVRRALAETKTEQDRLAAEDIIRKLTLAVDQSPASIFITDTHGVIEYANSRFSEVTGYTPADAIGRNVSIINSGLTQSHVMRDLWESIAAGRGWRGELCNRRKNGESYWDSVNISAIRNDAGEITHYLAIQEDITERRRIELEIRERDERFRQLADNSQEVFFIVDVNFTETLYMNSAYERLWGRTLQSAYDDPRSVLLPIDHTHRLQLLRDLDLVREGHTPAATEMKLSHPDGTERWVLAHAVPVRNDAGEIYRICAFILDITERRQTQQRLLASERRLRDLFETVALLVLAMNADGTIEYVNPFAVKLMGKQSVAMAAMPWMKSLAPTQSEEDHARIRHELLFDGRHSHHVSTLITPEGDERSISWHNTVLRDASGAPTGTLSVGEDVTDRLRLEEQLHQAQKMEAIGQLAGGVAHDFNNLLTVIMSYAELLRDSLDPGDGRIEDVTPILSAGEAAAGLTRQLLAFSRQEVIRPRAVVLEDTVAQSSRLLRRVIGEHIGLRTELSAKTSTVLIDPHQLEQIIMNLAVNARDAMPDGGLLTISTVASKEQTGVTASPSSYASLRVTDTGIGMTERVRARIFEPFFTTKEIGKGTGLGLATVYGIVKQAAGLIEVMSEPGNGTTFVISFPLAITESTDDVEVRRAPVPSGSETVLLVEDAAAVRAVARRVLERSGYTVLEATSGNEALAIAEKRLTEIDLLLTDVIMPEMSGRHLAERFAEMRPRAKVLYISGYTDDAIAHHGVLEPGIAFLQKPFTNDELVRGVRAVLDGKELEL